MNSVRIPHAELKGYGSTRTELENERKFPARVVSAGSIRMITKSNHSKKIDLVSTCRIKRVWFD